MKRLMIFCLAFQFAISVNAQNVTQDKISELRQLIIAADSISNRLLQALPSTFDEFDKIFGYSNSDKGELSSEAFVISFLDNNVFVNYNLLYEKLVSIAASPNSHWEADQIGEIHYSLLLCIEKNPKIIFTLLNELDRKSTEQFWYFIFDGPHPSNYRVGYDSAVRFAEQKRYPYLEIIKQSYAFHLKREQDSHY